MQQSDLGITYDYETNKGKMRYTPQDGPAFMRQSVVEIEFDITDDNIIEAHDFMNQQVIKQASNMAVSLSDGDQQSAT